MLATVLHIMYFINTMTNMVVYFLTHWGRDNMADILQTDLSNTWSCVKIITFCFKFHWILFPWVQLIFSICKIKTYHEDWKTWWQYHSKPAEIIIKQIGMKVILHNISSTFLHSAHNRQTINCPCGWYIECILWVQARCYICSKITIMIMYGILSI